MINNISQSQTRSRQLLQHEVEAVVVKVDGGIHRTRKERVADEENPALGRLLGTTNAVSVRNAAAVNRRQCGLGVSNS